MVAGRCRLTLLAVRVRLAAFGVASERSTVVTRPLQATGGELLLRGFGAQTAVAIVTNDASHAMRWVDKATKSMHSAEGRQAGSQAAGDSGGRKAVQLRLRRRVTPLDLSGMHLHFFV